MIHTIPREVLEQIPADRLHGLVVTVDGGALSYQVDGVPWTPGTPLPSPTTRCREVPSVFRVSTAEVCDTSSKPC